MAFGFSLGVALLLSLRLIGKCAGLPDGVLHMECHDRYFMTAVDLDFAGEEAHFAAVDETGVYPITERYGAECGYSVDVLPLQGQVVLRASYFSCHTDNREDEVFTFNFNLAVTREGYEVTHSFNRTCSPALPWSPREVTCEDKYMEVSVTSEVTCPSGTRTDDRNPLKLAHGSTTSDWQVMFQKGEEQLPAMNLSDARALGYVFDLTDGRLVFRTPYGQPDSSSTEVNGVPVEVVHAILFSRQSWVVLMVDLVTACSTYVASYNDIGYMVWETPDTLYPSLDSPRLSLGLNGELLQRSTAEERGYIVEKRNGTVRISVPYNAEGGYRKSVVADDLFEFYAFQLYVEQLLVDEDAVETRLQFHRTLTTPLLPYPIATESRALLEERMFTVYLGDVPADVDLAVVDLNREGFAVSFTNAGGNNLTGVAHPNDTHGYTLTVPFDDPVVLQTFSKEDSSLRYTLDINFTLIVRPEDEPYYHLVSVVAMFTDVSPPVFDAVCSESGIRFELDHRPFDYLWEISIGADPLTPELAARHGYVMSNDSRSLLLDVPLFAHGYEYENMTLEGLFGTFEILVRDRETSEVQSSSVKTCPFTRAEFIICSTDGRVTVLVDLSQTSPARSDLLDRPCGPKAVDDTRALFSFRLNECGSTVEFDLGYVTYQNEISYSKKFLNMNESDATERVSVQCRYPLAGLHRLFTTFRFESDADGIGSINRTTQPTSGLQSSTIRPTAPARTTPVAAQDVPISFQGAVHPTARYIKVSRNWSKGEGGSERAKGDDAGR